MGRGGATGLHGPAGWPRGQALGARGFRYTAVIEQVRPRQLAELLQRVREEHGGRYVYPTLAGTRELLRTLRAGGTVAMLVDRPLHHRAIGASGGQNLGGQPIGFPDDAQQDVLGPDVGVPEAERLAQ